MQTVGGVAGVLFGVLFIGGAFLPGPPPPIDSDPEDFMAFYARQGYRQQLANLLIAFGAIAFLLFLPSLAAAVGSGLGASAYAPEIVFGAGLVSIGLGMAGTAVFQALATSATKSWAPPTIAVIELVARLTRNISFFSQALLVAVAGWTFATRSGLEQVIGIAGIVVAIAVFASSTAVYLRMSRGAHIASLLTTIPLIVWYVTVGAALAMRAI